MEYFVRKHDLKFFGNSKLQEIIVQTNYILPAYQLFLIVLKSLYTLEIPYNEIPCNNASLLRARYGSP